jgi:hypothetical protein
MKRKHRKQTAVEMHQHIDKNGIVFGAKHPVMFGHKKLSTQKAHERTENDKPNSTQRV